MTTIFIARAYTTYRIASVEIVKETAKQYQVDEKTLTDILGRTYYVPARLNKFSRDYRIFTSLEDAQIWCVACIQNRVKSLEADLAMARAAIEDLRAKMGEGENLDGDTDRGGA